MNRRLAWTMGAVVAAGVIAVAAVWVWQSSANDLRESGASASPAASSQPTSSADLREIVRETLEKHLEGCAAEAAVGGSVPEGCGIRIPWGTEFAQVDEARFRIDRMPVLEIAEDDFVARDGVLVATVTGTGQDGAERTETYRTETWSVRGDIIVTGEQIDLDIR